MLAVLYDFGNLNVPGVQAGVDCNLTGAIKTLRRQRMGAASAGWSFFSGEAQGRFLSWGTTNVLIQRTTTKDVQESEGVERLSKICPMWSFEGSACAKSRGFFWI